MKRILGPHFKLFFLFFALGAGLTFALGGYLQFHALSNDYWNILYYGRGMTLAQPESLYNGFYPFGYAFLIGQMPFTYVLPLSYLLNALLTGLFTASVSTLISHTRSWIATLAALLASLAAPFVFQNAHALGPDIGAAAFTAFAVFMLWRSHIEGSDEELSDLNAAFIGASLGLGFLWRTHALISAVAVFIGFLLFTGLRPLRPRLWMLGVFFAFVALQVIVNLVSGHGPFETAQALNLYKFLYGLDWTHPPTPAELEDFSFIKTVMADPQAFLQTYRIPFFFLLSFSWTCIAAFVLSPKGRYARFALFSLLYIVLYSIPIAVGDSARAPLMLMVAYITAFALIPVALSEFIERLLGSRTWIPMAVALSFIAAGMNTFYGWFLYDKEVIAFAASERKVLSVIEQTLLSSGLTSPSEVFADRYDFYTPNVMPYRSRQIGNWNQDWVWGYAQEFPAIPNDSWEAFSAACRAQGIRFIVLGPNNFYRGEIFPPIYNDEVDLDAYGLRFIGQRGKMRIYEFK